MLNNSRDKCSPWNIPGDTLNLSDLSLYLKLYFRHFFDLV